MLNPIYDSLDRKIYAIASDLTYVEVDSEQAAYTRRPSPVLIVVKSNVGKTQSFYNTDFFAHSQYQFIQPGTHNAYYEERGWKLLSITEPHERSRSSRIMIADPTDHSKWLGSLQLNSLWTKFFQIEGICNVLRLIRFLAPYNSWNHLEQVHGPYLLALQRVDLSRSWYDRDTLQQNRRLYLWKLGTFLADNNSKMSLTELRKHLIRNKLQVTHIASEFQPEKIKTIVSDVEEWLSQQMNLPTESIRVARSFVSD